MADETKVPADGGETKPPADNGETTGAAENTDPRAELERWRALARKHEAEAKRNADAAAKLRQIEDAQKSEVEKLRDAAAAAEARAKQAEAEVLRWRVAVRLGLPPALASRLQGDTEEAIEADARDLMEAVGNKGQVRDLPRDRAGVSGATGKPAEDDDLDPRKLAARITRQW